MVRYIGPRLKIIRRLGLLRGLTKKNPKNRTKTPGQHGKILFKKIKGSSLSDDYRERLLEKQKLRFNYGLTEKQLMFYYKEAKKKRGSTGINLLKLIESRLDCILYRLGFASTIPAARQIVNHGHIIVNKKVVNIPSFFCEPGDQIEIKEKEKSQKFISLNYEARQEKRKSIQQRMKRINLTRFRFHTLLPKHLEMNDELLIGKVLSSIKRKDVLIKINELKVVEYYSR